MQKMFSFCSVLFLITACENETNTNTTGKRAEGGSKTASPIEGTWMTVSFFENGKEVTAKQFPQQVKMFHDGWFSFIMNDSSGKFQFAGAGPYELGDSSYTETFTFSSSQKWMDSKDWQRWELKGDTLIFSGFDKVVMADGTDVTNEFVQRRFVEKRVRLKR